MHDVIDPPWRPSTGTAGDGRRANNCRGRAAGDGRRQQEDLASAIE